MGEAIHQKQGATKMGTTNDPYLIFIHGLAKKPRPQKLEEIWLWALDQDNPKPEIFGNDNLGLSTLQRAEIKLTYWADVFYTDYEEDLNSYYERGEEQST